MDHGAILQLNGAAIDGGTVTNNGTFDLTGTAVLKNGTLDNSGEIDVSGTGNALDNETVTINHALEILAGGTLLLDEGTTVANAGGTITIDDSATLTLMGGVSLNDGTINDGTAGGTGTPALFGSIDVTGSSTIGNALLNNGGVTVASGVTLTLDNDTVNGTFFNDTASGASIQVDDGTILTLTGGAALNGGTINDGTASGTAALFGGIDVIGPGTISNALLNNGGVTVASGVTLTLDNDTVNGTIFGVIDTGTIDLGGAVTFESGVAVNGGEMSIASGATLDVENFVTGIGANLDGVNVINSGTIQVDRPGERP